MHKCTAIAAGGTNQRENPGRATIASGDHQPWLGGEASTGNPEIHPAPRTDAKQQVGEAAGVSYSNPTVDARILAQRAKRSSPLAPPDNYPNRDLESALDPTAVLGGYISPVAERGFRHDGPMATQRHAQNPKKVREKSPSRRKCLPQILK